MQIYRPGRDGKIIGKHNKVHPAVGGLNPYCWPPLKPHDLEWEMKKGDDFNVFELDFGTIGIMTCYDGYFSEPADILSLKGAEIVCWINGRAGPIEEFIVKLEKLEIESYSTKNLLNHHKFYRLYLNNFLILFYLF